MWDGKIKGSGCDAVGRAVASDTRGPRFESSHRQIYMYYQLYWKDENKEKRGRERPNFKKKIKRPLDYFYTNYSNPINYVTIWRLINKPCLSL